MKEIKIDIIKNEVVMTRSFADKAADPRTNEYRILQDVMNTYPNIHVRRHRIKQNPGRECYKGLTYEYMRKYIASHGEHNEAIELLKELNEMILISRCHSIKYRYPTIKAWFLKQYPDIEKFGMEEETTDDEVLIVEECDEKLKPAA